MTALGLAAWALVGGGIAAAIFGALNRRSRRRVTVAIVLVMAAGLGLLVVAFAGMGAFCVPPPGAGCM